MPRRKLSEYRAKKILTTALGLDYEGWSVGTDQKDLILSKDRSYVVKVDQAIKGRFKKGLVALNVDANDVRNVIDDYARKGHQSFLIEPFMSHANEDERYLSLTHDEMGMSLSVNRHGGVDIEASAHELRTYVVARDMDWQEVSQVSGFSEEQLHKIVQTYEDNFFTFLEINPYVVHANGLRLLDVAVEVDDAAMYLVETWNKEDIRIPARTLTEEEKIIDRLSETSPASFSLQIINPDASIFVLLSGGGASVVIADEIYNSGMGNALANYGEYSGNPSEEETYIYASAVINAAIQSHAEKKVLFIGGAVANFTNISKTFSGIIRAIEERSDDLRATQVKVFVRRGGPQQEEGLRKMHKTLEEQGLLGSVFDQSTPIHAAVSAMIKEVR